MKGALISKTVKYLIFDRGILGIFALILLFGFVPVFSSLSMRQLQEISITMSLSLNSFILLLFSIFGGTMTIWRDIERRYTYTILSYPITRTQYVLSKFAAVVILLVVITTLDFILSYFAITISASMYKSQLPILWGSIALAFFMQLLKYIMLASFAFLFSSFATSFFLPIFSTIAVYFAGNASQGIFDYIMKNSSQYPGFFKAIVKAIYYIVPNFNAFDFTVNATYDLPINSSSIVITLVYFVVYTALVLSLALMFFNRRDLT